MKAMSPKGAPLPDNPEAMELVAARFKVLSEPLRLRILQELDGGEKSVSELTEAVHASQPNVSKHLKILQDAGLVGRRQSGNTVYCFISDPTVFELCHVVCGSLRDRLESQARVFSPRTRR
jgi:DNA-binding transcriptional ArsR family regulator